MKKYLTGFLLAALLGLLIGCTNQRLQENRDLGISATELQAKLGGVSLPLLIDVRTSDEFYAGHLTGARLFPANDIFMNVHQIPTDKEIIVYCSDGQRSLLVAKHLHSHGFNRVKRLNDGIKAWPGEIER
jgi:rhodanese-related sulfurtransferase